MYKAMSGSGEAEWRDGVFAKAAPWQAYQASLNEFESGSLGVAPVGARSKRDRLALLMSRGRGVQSPLPTPQAGAFRSGALGRSFLPAFTRRQMRGLGYAYQDGSLGDTTTLDPCTPVRTCMDDVLSAPQPMDRALADPFNKLVAASLLGIVAYLVYKR